MRRSERVRPAEIEANEQNHLAGAQGGGGEGNEKSALQGSSRDSARPKMASVWHRGTFAKLGPRLLILIGMA